jgi:hypothetical protein
LSTAPSNSTSAFAPSATQWRSETVNLPSLANQPSVFVKFVATSYYGNNLYIDNVNLGQPTSVVRNNRESVTMMLFPNPSSDRVNLSINLAQNEPTEITIMNSIGQTVYSLQNNDLHTGNNLITLNSENWNSGIYFVRVQTTEGFDISKLTIIK